MFLFAIKFDNYWVRKKLTFNLFNLQLDQIGRRYSCVGISTVKWYKIRNCRLYVVRLLIIKTWKHCEALQILKCNHDYTQNQRQMWKLWQLHKSRGFYFCTIRTFKQCKNWLYFRHILKHILRHILIIKSTNLFYLRKGYYTLPSHV